jgi:hypothetical protein
MYGSSGGIDVLRELGQYDLVRSAITANTSTPVRGSSAAIKTGIQNSLELAGWASGVRLEIDRGPEINSFHFSGIALQVQLGNIARAFYDLMKLESVWRLGRIGCGVLIVPSKAAARAMGDNLANFERVTEEHESLFSQFVCLPLVVFAFE